MKALVILGDGMADEPIDMFGGKTPLQYAHTPYMDKLAELGVTGRMKTVPDGFHPGSEVANLSVLGYDLQKVYEGRGVLEAASIGVTLQAGEIAMRCNLICIEDDKIKNHSAGHISTEEADILIKYLEEKLGSEQVKFHTGVSYRHLLVIKGGDKRLDCTPPHDVPLQPFRPLMIKPEVPEASDTTKLLNKLILKSQELLKEHPINLKRIAAGKDPANSIWPWSPGYRPAMQTMQEMHGFRKGAVISAVDLIRGIGVYAGLDVINVEGATGLYNTNYEGKVQAALEALRTNDFVYLHIEASDEAGHEGDVALKVKTIENLDHRVVHPIYEALTTWNESVAIGILPDHPTPCAIRTHTNTPVPFIIYKPGEKPDSVTKYDEFSIEKGKFGILEKDQFIKVLLG
ncbi:2,3-bisphosphoglycerate-independent phosphoglycerate mutase [Parabacteroides sp. PF5-5]|uniref:cofactor-independent phosphoglycerate mutase n=1 Tax=unclassified Parabacteroides TaxID=2649774 RepID=UPI00247583CE|nr:MULTISPECIES: cofactor-independent phosphoglycerate mutase [unclassified Parabacteroides]MDH6304536.1 2,3-bisphosphoglycerate-independent phosphoglycerate mutase [Parabacteroides sp. PH5-39]MDH6315312.1 2,3-bisphosphoglycerate-independent phosphoglycerate mutase [Parabacteroides sp. PF5-13]MDH6319194.1 2,3-bisphosphoglycerate-independent phosphoglycerate mutase [Parabacteroides sp. PH5-13]MDH6322925.1 2,3-bisphosphoglycerate-independent phosphoglycerate mutase [Parabacteroides sp. PH5-8]MDH